MKITLPIIELRFKYTNHRGESEYRHMTAYTMFFGTTEYHKEPQWFISGFCFDRNRDRDFAMKDMSEVVKVR